MGLSPPRSPSSPKDPFKFQPTGWRLTKMSVEHILGHIGCLWSDAMNKFTAFSEGAKWVNADRELCGNMWSLSRYGDDLVKIVQSWAVPLSCLHLDGMESISFPAKIRLQITRQYCYTDVRVGRWLDTKRRIQAFEIKCYRRMLGISYREHRTNMYGNR